MGGDWKVRGTKKHRKSYLDQIKEPDNDSRENVKVGDIDCLHLFKSDMQFDDSILLETELVGEVADLSGGSQVLEYMDSEFKHEGSDEQEIEKTEVLSDDDEVSDDETGACRSDYFGNRRTIRDNVTGVEKQPVPLCLHGKGMKDCVVDSDKLRDGQCSSGSLLRSFTSVRIASLRSSGLAAPQGITYKGTAVWQNRISTINQDTQRQGNVEILHPDPGACGNEKSDSVTGLRDSTTFFRPEVHEQTCLHDTEISQRNMTEMFRDEAKNRIKNSRVRKLIFEDTPAGEMEAISKITTTAGKVDPPRFLMSEHEVAGLSHVGSQEHDIELQANALSVVDKVLLLLDAGLTGKGNTGVPLDGKSPPVSSANGTQSLAKRAFLRSLERNTGTFDWVDSREDETGGDFFSKRKDDLFEDIQSRKPKHLTFKGVQNVVDKCRETGQEGGTEIHQKIMGLTCPVMRSMLQSSTESDKIQIPETMTRNNSFPELIEKSNVESSGDRLGTDADDSSLQGLDDIDVNTQLAVEAFEALVCGPPANQDIADKLPVTQKVMAGSKKNKGFSRHVSAKRGRCMSDSDGTMRQSKHKKMLHSKSSEGSYEPEEHLPNLGAKLLRQNSPVKTRAMKEKQRYKEHFGGEKFANRNKYLVEKSSRHVKIGQTRGALTGTCNEKMDKCHTSLIDNRLSFSKSLAEEELPHKIVEPIAHRTRRSMMNSLKRARIPSIDCVLATNCSRDNGILQNKSVVNCNADAPEPLTKARSSPRLGPNQSSKIGKDKGEFEKQAIAKGLHEEKFQISYQKKDASSYNEGWKTHRSMSDNLDKTSNSNVPSATIDGVMKANAQIFAQEKSSKINATSTFLSFNTDTVKRRTRSASRSTLPPLPLPMTVLPKPDVASCSNITSEVDSLASEPCEPSMDQTTSGSRRVPIVYYIRRRSSGISCMSVSSDKKSAEILIRDKLLESDTVNCAVDCSMDVTNDKAPTEHMILPNTGAPTLPASDDGADLSTLPVKGSPKEKIPKETATLSPVCIGDDPEKLSGKRCLPRSSLIRELVRLDATEMKQTHSVKDMRRRRDMASVSVLFSHHLGEDIIKQQKKILARLGASIASSSSDATHFIADKFVRTRNMLEAMALGKPVVTHFWLETCGQASCFIDEKGYILRDLKMEKEIGFSMPVSLARAPEKPLLQSKKVYITPNVKPDREVVASLVKAVHGQAIGRIGRFTMKGDTVPNDLLVISCEEDYSICIPFLEKGAVIYGSELLLNGIVIQKLEYERHRLFMDHVKRTRSTIWLRKSATSLIQ